MKVKILLICSGLILVTGCSKVSMEDSIEELTQKAQTDEQYKIDELKVDKSYEEVYRICKTEIEGFSFVGEIPLPNTYLTESHIHSDTKEGEVIYYYETLIEGVFVDFYLHLKDISEENRNDKTEVKMYYYESWNYKKYSILATNVKAKLLSD
jgi:hypothetical protein